MTVSGQISGRLSQVMADTGFTGYDVKDVSVATIVDWLMDLTGHENPKAVLKTITFSSECD